MDPILLLHGALGSKSQLDPLKNLLEASGLKVYSINFSGHNGAPFVTTFGIETFAEDIVRFVMSSGIERINIFGYSMGGYAALWFALEHPELGAKIITLGTKFDWSPESAANETRKLDPDKIRQKIPAFARILESRHAPNNWEELLHKTSAMMKDLGNKPLLTEVEFQKITQKVLILLGDQDDMADRRYSEKVANVIPSGTFELLRDTQHPIEKVNLAALSSILMKYFTAS